MVCKHDGVYVFRKGCSSGEALLTSVDGKAFHGPEAGV